MTCWGRSSAFPRADREAAEKGSVVARVVAVMGAAEGESNVLRSALRALSPVRLHAHLQPVELLLQAVEGVVADLLARAHVEHHAAGLGEGAAMDVLVARARRLRLAGPGLVLREMSEDLVTDRNGGGRLVAGEAPEGRFEGPGARGLDLSPDRI